MNAGIRGTLSSVGSALVGHLAGAPWWAVTGCTVLLLGVIALQTVFPQNSADRLAWWKDRRRYRSPRPRRDRPPAVPPPANGAPQAPPARGGPP
ncbi:hypothetical protein ACWDCB_44115 [Streptomyces sp. NPDC001178]